MRADLISERSNSKVRLRSPCPPRSWNFVPTTASLRRSCGGTGNGSCSSLATVSMMEPNPGFLLLGSDLRPLYVNPEATQILAYPDTPRSIGPLDSFLLRKIRAVFFAHGNEGQFASEFLSGRRRYLCRAYWLCPPSNNALNH